MKQHIDIHAKYTVECFSPEGELQWKENFRNLVTNNGRHRILVGLFLPAHAADPWYVGLKGPGAPAITDNAPISEKAWTEFLGYSEAGRPLFDWGTQVSGQQVDNIGRVAVFNVTEAGTVAGAFLTEKSDKTNTEWGIILSVGDFVSGPKEVVVGSVLRVTVVFSTAAEV